VIPNRDLTVTGRSTLELFPLKVKPEGREFIVGRPSTGSYAALSNGALEAAALLARGHSIAAAKTALASRGGQGAPRLRPLLETLLAAGMVKSVDGVPLAEPRAPRRYHLAFLRRRHVAWLFSRPAAAIYAVLVALGVGIVLADPRYLPRPADALVVSDPIKNLVLLWGVSLIAMAAHELAHLLAATSLGVKASFALSYRLFFAVAETDLTDLWLVERSKRYLAYAAGMVNDIVLACAAVIALWLHDQQLLPLPAPLYGTLRLAVLVLLFGVLWQFNLYLRTDVYYLVANATGCRNLSHDATAYVKDTLARWFTGAAPQRLAGMPRKEMRIVRGYAALVVLGTTAVVAMGAAYLGAVLVVLLGGHPASGGAHDLMLQATPGGLAPALASLAITSCWLAYAFVGKRRKRPRVRYRLVTPEDL
jgi:putative peptide zinc metalloprotease protein